MDKPRLRCRWPPSFWPRGTYRTLKGKADWTRIYTGPLTAAQDKDAFGVVPPNAKPGHAEEEALNSALEIYEYAIAAANGNGEGPKSGSVDTDPASWRSWWPAGQERRFQRQTAFLFPPYVAAGMTPPRRYPDALSGSDLSTRAALASPRTK